MNQKMSIQRVSASIGACLLVIASSSNGAITEVTDRYTIQTDIIPSQSVIENTLVPVGAFNSFSHIYKDITNTYKGHPSFLFQLKDDKNGERVELCSSFVTDKVAEKIPPQQLKDIIAARALGQHSSGHVTTGDTWVYEYGLWIPSSVGENSKGIISQWHGTPDRTTVVTPDKKTERLSLRSFVHDLLAKMYFEKSIGYDKKTRKPNGYFVDQDGYPPLSLQINNGWFYVLARDDMSRVTDKTDRINLRPPEKGPVSSPGKTKHVCIPYMVKLKDIPKDKWIDMKWEIVWSDWAKDGSKILDQGSIKLFMDGKPVFSWKGYLGNNNEFGTYFKYGIYKPGASGISIRLAGFRQYKLGKGTEQR
ncbi:heparin lyase I family protein [Candidatus Sororendozoicomonas aggregata]|uniref:heparin lyase I family protein n=1 Tax=Candidatus Sororendozoicomonas aggregata TaxID=3073239 RepID=UPI002ED18B93